MSSSSQQPAPAALPAARLFATYGTIRDDDDSGAEWTRAFLRGLVPPARTGAVRGFAMWRNARDNWPWAVPVDSATDGDTSVITVRALNFGDSAAAFAAKLAEADEIEGYRPDGSGQYDRVVVDIRLAPCADGGHAQTGHARTGDCEHSRAAKSDCETDKADCETVKGVFYYLRALPAPAAHSNTASITDTATAADSTTTAANATLASRGRFVDATGLVWKRDRGGDWLRRDRDPTWFTYDDDDD